MPKKVKEASAVEVKRWAKQDGLHAVGGVAGLQLQVRGASTSWILRTTVGSRRRDIGLGAYPDVPLTEARDRARIERAKIRDGIDPVEERRATRAALASVLTFDEAARRLIASKSAEWKNAKHKDQWQNTLDTYASPRIGKLPVDKVELPHIVDVLDPIWKTKTETASRLRSRIEAVLGWATVSGYRTGDNPARWRGHLDKVLAKPSKVRKVKHHTALSVDGMHDFMVELRKRDGMAARALEFAILTATRSQEVRGATWSEINLADATWTIPGARMKAGKEHKVPLPPRAVKLLKALPRYADCDIVFPSPTVKVLSDMSLSAVTKRMEVGAVPHGFRSTFRDWAAERTHYPRDVAEMALAHTIGDKVEAAYRRGDLFDKRTKMMADWSKFIDAPPAKGDNVTPIRRKA
jgi:integrase